MPIVVKQNGTMPKGRLHLDTKLSKFILSKEVGDMITFEEAKTIVPSNTARNINLWIGAGFLEFKENKLYRTSLTKKEYLDITPPSRKRATTAVALKRSRKVRAIPLLHNPIEISDISEIDNQLINISGSPNALRNFLLAFRGGK